MDLRDVITVSPRGISKIDSGLFFEESQLVTWDVSNTSRIFAAEKGRLLSFSAVNGSSSAIKCSSYEADGSDSIGLSTTNEYDLVYSELPVANNLNVCKAYGNHMICGGRDVLFSVWDLEKSEAPIFTSKNVRPDTLDLKVPIWVSDASFVEGYESRLFVTSSKYGDFCVYDLRSGQRRPVSRSAWRVSNKQGKKSVGTGHNPAMLRDLTVTRPITRCVAYTSAPGGGLRAVAANAIGDICRLDFRVPHVSLISDEGAEKKRKARSVGARAPAAPNYVLGYMPPSLGSVSALVCGGAGCANLPHAMPGANINDQPVVVSASLDRYIRVYHRDTGELINKIRSQASQSLIELDICFTAESFGLEPLVKSSNSANHLYRPDLVITLTEFASIAIESVIVGSMTKALTAVRLAHIFTKAPVSTFLIRESATVPLTANNGEGTKNSEKDEQDAAVEGGDVWEQMETVEEPPLKRTKEVKQK
ncbi:hypothetical protein ACTXT7_009981 [Hymenolepis weldensis]